MWEVLLLPHVRAKKTSHNAVKHLPMFAQVIRNMAQIRTQKPLMSTSCYPSSMYIH